MKTVTSLLILTAVLIGFTASADDRGETSEFSMPTIDLGCVVSDIDASLEFYTEAIGFQQASGFQVDAQFATEAGLTNQQSLDVKVLKLGEGGGATKLKLMQIGSQGGERSANEFIETTLGFSYITIFVKSTDAAMKRLKRAGVEPVANGPVTLPANLDPSLALIVVRDPDGNFIELVGPKPAN